MKRAVIVCQTAPGTKRRLAEESLRLAAGLAATARCAVDYVLQDGGLLFLEPEFHGSALTWESFQPPHHRVWVSRLPPSPPAGLSLHVMAPGELETLTHGADFVLRF